MITWIVIFLLGRLKRIRMPPSTEDSFATCITCTWSESPLHWKCMLLCEWSNQARWIQKIRKQGSKILRARPQPLPLHKNFLNITYEWCLKLSEVLISLKIEKQTLNAWSKNTSMQFTPAWHKERSDANKQNLLCWTFWL